MAQAYPLRTQHLDQPQKEHQYKSHVIESQTQGKDEEQQVLSEVWEPKSTDKEQEECISVLYNWCSKEANLTQNPRADQRRVMDISRSHV